MTYDTYDTLSELAVPFIENYNLYKIIKKIPTVSLH
jgi:hypothetical protein